MKRYRVRPGSVADVALTIFGLLLAISMWAMLIVGMML